MVGVRLARGHTHADGGRVVASRRGMLTQMEGWCWACAWACSRRWKGGVGLARGHARADGGVELGLREGMLAQMEGWS